MSDNKKETEEIEGIPLINIFNLTNLSKIINYILRRDNINAPQRYKIKTVLLRHARLAVKEIKHILNRDKGL